MTTTVATPVPLGDRMKNYERATRTYLPTKTFTIVRVDGRAFTQFTRKLDKPFDSTFSRVMDEVARAMCLEVSGSVLAYTQSDEISLILSDHGPKRQPWVGGQVQKLVSLTAGIASAQFVKRAPSIWTNKTVPIFDSRVFTIDQPHEVCNYLLWRQRDARRNAVGMLASSRFSHRELHGKTTEERARMLTEIGASPATHIPDGVFHGRVINRVTVAKATEHNLYPRLTWDTRVAPDLNADPDGFVASILPDIEQVTA